MTDELTIKLIKIAEGTTRLVVWKDNQVEDIFEADDIRNVLNHQLQIAFEHGFTDIKFKVRK